MPELAFLRHGEEMMCYQLHQSSVRVGRGPENDLVLPPREASISRYHLLVEKNHNQFWLRDLSNQGIQINGEKVQYHPLKDGDRFVLGRYQVEFRERNRYVQQTLHLHTGDSTQRIDPTAAANAVEGILSWEENGRALEMPIGLQPVNIGKSDDNNIVVTQPYVSSFHCRIFQRSGRFFLRDLDSLNGTWVNGMKVIESELPEEAEIYVGRFPFTFRRVVETAQASAPTSSANTSGMVGQSPSLLRALELGQRMAQSDVPVLIEGESGTGKELMARAIHDWSSRADAPFVAINCGAISKELIESTLFGHEKGAFTGAMEARPGVFEQAGAGTIFLDEIGELPLEQQVTFLRVLETGTYRRIGGVQELKTNARIIAATHRDLRFEVQAGRFREDLMFRICVLRLPLPALRDRAGDIEILVQHFVQEYAPHRDIRFSAGAMQRLLQHPWSGNVRELRNAIQRALIMAEGAEIQEHELLLDQMARQTSIPGALSAPVPVGVIPAPVAQPPVVPAVSSTPVTEDAPRTLKEIEKQAIVNTLEACNYNISQAARMLGIGRASLYSKMDRFGLRDSANNKN